MEGTWTASDGTLTTIPTSDDFPPDEGIYQTTVAYSVRETVLVLVVDVKGVDFTHAFTIVVK